MILWCSAFGMINWNKASFTMVKVAILPELQKKKGEQACYQGNDTNFFRSDQTSSHLNATREKSFEFLCLNSAACCLLFARSSMGRDETYEASRKQRPSAIYGMIDNSEGSIFIWSGT